MSRHVFQHPGNRIYPTHIPIIDGEYFSYWIVIPKKSPRGCLCHQDGKRFFECRRAVSFHQFKIEDFQKVGICQTEPLIKFAVFIRGPGVVRHISHDCFDF